MSEKKDSLLYHGSNEKDIKALLPQKRYGPSSDRSSAVYASDLPAYAIAHSIPWSTKEGVTLQVKDNSVHISIPNHLHHRFERPVFLYELSKKPFEKTNDRTSEHTYHTTQSVMPKKIRQYHSFYEAMRAHGGSVSFHASPIHLFLSKLRSVLNDHGK